MFLRYSITSLALQANTYMVSLVTVQGVWLTMANYRYSPQFTWQLAKYDQATDPLSIRSAVISQIYCSPVQ